MTSENYAVMLERGMQLATGLRQTLATFDLPWHVAQLGARVEVVFAPDPVRNAEQARAAASSLIEGAVHLAMLNRGFLLTPFHNMLLASPALSAQEATGLISAYADVLAHLAAARIS